MSDEGVSSPAPLSTQRKAQRAVPFVIASGLMSVVMNLAGLFLLVRYLAPEEYGVWVLLTGLSPLVGLFTSFGFEQSLMRYMPVRPEGQPRSELFWAIMLRRLAFVGFASLVLVATFPWFAERFGLAGHFSEFLLVQPAIVLLTSTGYASIGLNIAFRQREAFIAALVQQLSYLAGVAFGIATRQPLVYFVVVNSVSAVALFVVSMGYCIRSFGAPSLRLLLRPLAEDDRERRYRRASYVNAAADNLLSSDVTRYLLAAFSTTSEVATYALA
jgi:O-antigen/teichoic acid export membrane protein